MTVLPWNQVTMYLGFDSIKIMHVVYCFHGNRVLIEMLQWSLGGGYQILLHNSYNR